jgi:hypothetical protein
LCSRRPLPVWVCDKSAEHLDVIGSFADLAAREKIFVDLGCSSHNAMWERNHGILFKASAEWLTAGSVNGAKQGVLFLMFMPGSAGLFSTVAKMSGDPSLFDDGVKILEARTQKPCLGVFPMLQNVFLDAEDAGVRQRAGEHVAMSAPGSGDGAKRPATGSQGGETQHNRSVSGVPTRRLSELHRIDAPRSSRRGTPGTRRARPGSAGTRSAAGRPRAARSH